jgi:tRNA(adenine34) deaminase
MRSSLLAVRGFVKKARGSSFGENVAAKAFADVPSQKSGSIARMLFSQGMESRSTERHVEMMRIALEEATAAATAGEVPVGAVLVRDSDGVIVARGANRTIRDCDPTAHAEVVVLREAARAIGNYRLAGTTLYVTIEPCTMCAGAIVQARVPRVVYGCDDVKGGAVRSCFEVLSHPKLNHQVEVTAGVLATECAAVMQAFFAKRR